MKSKLIKIASIIALIGVTTLQALLPAVNQQKRNLKN